MNKIILSLIILIGLSFLSCNENPVINAENMDLETLINTPGFSWYMDEVNNYKPDPTYISQLQSIYNPKTDHFVIYVKPSCACYGTYKQFPAMMKVFKEVGILKENYKIYSMTSIYNEYPEKNIIKINELPSLFIVKNGNYSYSVIDTISLRNRLYNDSLRVEKILLEGLSK